ncbi:hypothetical protein H0H93_015163 [Arthromyces matolae]|nr:hypothetical protein H0H93_015163 [Arthromyces matolae]
MPPRRSEQSLPDDLQAVLFEFQSGRWLYNEREQQACRYMKWDLDNLITRACTVLEAKEAVRLEKLPEGSYNRAFLIAFDNDKEAILRIPCPLAGPSGPVTASEVATMEFAREVLGIPVPNVLDWSSDPGNPVGHPYLLMDNISGIGLGERGLLDSAAGKALFDDCMSIEKSFEKVRFSQLGSLYFTQDVSAELQARPLFADDMDLSTETLRKAASKYRIGPLVDRQWYRGERAAMTVDRGPWPDFVSYFLAGINLELAWLEDPGSKSQPFRRTAMQSPQFNRSVLEMCAKVIPLSLPDDKYMAPTLWHPDFDRANLLVPPLGEAHIQAVIDWQHAMIGPYAFQAGFPAALIYDGDMSEFERDFMGLPLLPEDLDQRTTEERIAIQTRHRYAKRQKGYEYYISMYNPRRLEAINLPQSRILNMLPYYISRSWSDGVGPITEALLSLRDAWESVVGLSGTPCPLDELTEGEIQKYRAVAEQSKRFVHAVDALNGKLVAGGDGKVPVARYEQTKEECERLRKEWDEERDGGTFPYQDGGYSFFLS